MSTINSKRSAKRQYRHSQLFGKLLTINFLISELIQREFYHSARINLINFVFTPTRDQINKKKEWVTRRQFSSLEIPTFKFSQALFPSTTTIIDFTVDARHLLGAVMSRAESRPCKFRDVRHLVNEMNSRNRFLIRPMNCCVCRLCFCLHSPPSSLSFARKFSQTKRNRSAFVLCLPLCSALLHIIYNLNINRYWVINGSELVFILFHGVTDGRWRLTSLLLLMFSGDGAKTEIFDAIVAAARYISF